MEIYARMLFGFIVAVVVFFFLFQVADVSVEQSLTGNTATTTTHSLFGSTQCTTKVFESGGSYTSCK